MIILTHGGKGTPYSSDFLDGLAQDLTELAIDFEKAGGSPAQAERLLRARDTVRHIRISHNAS